jgi:hypothetical protein
LEASYVPVNIGTSNAFSHGNPDSHDDWLTGINRDIRTTRNLIVISFVTHNHTHDRQSGYSFFHEGFNRRRKGKREAINFL